MLAGSRNLGVELMEMAAAVSTPLAITSSSSSAPLIRLRFLSPHLLPRPRPSLRLHSTSYNGWGDLAADPDLPFAVPPSLHALLPLLLLPVAAVSPILAAAFAAGFAARHLAPSPSHSHRHRLANLDAQVQAFKDRLPSAGLDAALLLDAVDRLRDAAAALPAQPMLADYLGGWARHTIRDLTFVRRKPKAAAQPQQQHEQTHGDKHLDSSSIHGTTNHSTLQDRSTSLDSVIPASGRGSTARPDHGIGVLPFDLDANGLDHAGSGAQSTLQDAQLEMESLVFKHRYGNGRRSVHRSFQGASFAAESMESSLLQIRNRSYRLKIEHHGREGGGQVSKEREQPADHFVGFDPTDDESASTTDADGEEFSRNVKEATEILRIARECMIARADEETTDALLYKSARLLSTAVALKPKSLVAVGQLGNTYLLHGELKLKISRELRTLLANSGDYLNANADRVSLSTKLDRRVLTRENISSALVDVCQECESLLVESGRSYRMALLIDSGDVKALYNWGLALIFRAQLLADIGPEAAVDADRVYLAAIDKFDVMLSKGNTYAPEALYRWGTVLQQRSHLRSGSGRNKEKIRLLEQAKSMFEDVLYVEANNKMAREALSSCITELNYHGRWL